MRGADYLRQVRRGIDYIEDRLGSEVDLADVARHADTSQWHFQRIFKALTNETLKTYVRSRRFAHALDKIAHTEERIIEIALDVGFDSQEAFTRAFKKAFGVTPARYRKSHQRVPFLRKVRFDEEYLIHLHGGASLEPELSVEPARALVGLSSRFFGSDSDKNNVATKLPALWGAFMPRLPEVAVQPKPIGYGVIQQTSERSDELEYLAAVEVTTVGWYPFRYREARPTGGALRDVPASWAFRSARSASMTLLRGADTPASD